jgi:magnesium-transporting ATPase (P-type)
MEEKPFQAEKIEKNEEDKPKRRDSTPVNQRRKRNILVQKGLNNLLANLCLFFMFILPLLRNSDYESIKSNTIMNADTLFFFRMGFLGFIAFIINNIGILYSQSNTALKIISALFIYLATIIVIFIAITYTSMVVRYNDKHEKISRENPTEGEKPSLEGDLLLTGIMISQLCSLIVVVFEIVLECIFLVEAKVIKFRLD